MELSLLRKAKRWYGDSTCFTFFLKMKDETEKIPITAKLLSQKQALRRLNKNTESKQHHLTALWDAYNRFENRLSSKDLLEALEKLTKNHSRVELKSIMGYTHGNSRFDVFI